MNAKPSRAKLTRHVEFVFTVDARNVLRLGSRHVVANRPAAGPGYRSFHARHQVAVRTLAGGSETPIRHLSLPKLATRP